MQRVVKPILPSLVEIEISHLLTAFIDVILPSLMWSFSASWYFCFCAFDVLFAEVFLSCTYRHFPVLVIKILHNPFLVMLAQKVIKFYSAIVFHEIFLKGYWRRSCCFYHWWTLMITVCTKYYVLILIGADADKKGDKNFTESLWRSKYCKAAWYCPRSALKDS